ncbi:aryl-sulfate sulfohydrolase [Echinicola pacifica]|uniref:Aryl-sulfate sulfohydrolase n=1 Tax=Echinicola pacifica TaxID=346377 RepID=A0A918UJ08_9BACT|nr:sulfatase [Echinicola pacifica]GGZ13232.1 aryl-sulfate sulfohydrolase [Echinicola pacifica]
MKSKISSYFLLALSLAYYSCAGTQSKQEVAEEKLNVILINVDDLGWNDLGYMGATFYETPNIDKLASRSVVFNQAYAGAANCAPSRANMLTGRYGMTHGVYTVHPADRGNSKTRRLIPSHNEKFIPEGMATLGRLFKDNGYKTGTFGKWHVSPDPTKNGFDVNVAGGPQGNPGKGGYFSPYKVDNIESTTEGEFLTDRLTNEAMKFVDENKSAPFFLYLPFYTVHSPLMAKEEDLARFANKEGKPGRNNATYAAMIYNMDHNVGRLLQHLEELGLAENTLIIFTSDNGGIRATSYQDPLRAGKGSYYEGGIRVPLLISQKGKYIHRLVEDPVSQMDFFPTLKHLIEGELAADVALDGQDLTAVLDGENQGHRDIFFHFPIYLEAYKPKVDEARDPLFRTRPGSVIRSGDWKLHQYFEDGGLELYNLREDLGETNNLAEQQPEKVQELLQKLEDWRSSHQAPVPVELNPDFDADFEQKQIQKVLK